MIASSKSALSSFTTTPAVLSLLTEMTEMPLGDTGAPPLMVAPCATSLPPKPNVAPHGRFNQFGARFIGTFGPEDC